jgi:sulfite reductase (NADPH) flavoprotein alpha-component
MSSIPLLPETAPFSPEQRAWLNGFFAGLFSRANAPIATSASESKMLQPLTILFGSQTGTSESLAKRAAKEAGKRGFAPTVVDMAQTDIAKLAGEKNVLVITSTYGDGEPPDNAKSLWEALAKDDAPSLASLNFSVCALGDTNYARPTPRKTRRQTHRRPRRLRPRVRRKIHQVARRLPQRPRLPRSGERQRAVSLRPL